MKIKGRKGGGVSGHALPGRPEQPTAKEADVERERTAMTMTEGQMLNQKRRKNNLDPGNSLDMMHYAKVHAQHREGT
jgi:hypothetical protein